jgi:hypothetical protein
MTNTVYVTQLVSVECGACGIPHGLPQNMQAARLEDGALWYCPNGHRIGYTDNDAARLRRELKASNDARTRLIHERDQAEASRRAWKGQATKARNRAAAGTCPFCGQHLRDLERHVARQHGDLPAADAEPQP